MDDTSTPKSWFARRVQKCYEKDKMKQSERFGEFVGIVALFILTLFFVYHQLLSTGFFTTSFGLLEVILFYASIPIGIATGAVRIIKGSRNTARPLEVVSAVIWIATGFWLFLVFPFDFLHLGDVLPISLQFLLSWIPDWLGRCIIFLTGLIGTVNAIYIPSLYISIRKELAKHMLPTA